MNHGRDVELDQLLVERIPQAIGEWQPIPITPGRIGIEVAADETELLDAARQLADAALRIDAGRLRQLTDADEILRIELGQAVDQLVRYLRPFEADAFIADMVGHAGGPRREDR